LFATKVNRVCFCFYFRFLLFGFCYNTCYFSPYYAYNIYYFICLIAIIFMVFSVPLMATLIYPLNIHLHVATNFACVGFTLLIPIHPCTYINPYPYIYKDIYDWFARSVHYVFVLICNVRLPHEYLSTVYSLFIWYICRFIYNFDQLNSAPFKGQGSQCPIHF